MAIHDVMIVDDGKINNDATWKLGHKKYDIHENDDKQRIYTR